MGGQESQVKADKNYVVEVITWAVSLKIIESLHFEVLV